MLDDVYCSVQRATRSLEARLGGGEDVRRRSVQGTTGDAGLDHEDDRFVTAFQTGKSEGDYELPPGSPLRRPLRPRVREPADDFAGDIIGEDMLPS